MLRQTAETLAHGAIVAYTEAYFEWDSKRDALRGIRYALDALHAAFSAAGVVRDVDIQDLKVRLLM